MNSSPVIFHGIHLFLFLREVLYLWSHNAPIWIENPANMWLIGDHKQYCHGISRWFLVLGFLLPLLRFQQKYSDWDSIMNLCSAYSIRCFLLEFLKRVPPVILPEVSLLRGLQKFFRNFPWSSSTGTPPEVSPLDLFSISFRHFYKSARNVHQIFSEVVSRNISNVSRRPREISSRISLKTLWCFF